MMKKILYFQPDKEKLQDARLKYLKLLAGFLALMLLCTVLSRIANSLLVPIVQVEKVGSGVIVREISIDGMIEANKHHAVSAKENIRVQSVEVEEGSQIKEGDLLFTLDLGSLSESLSRQQLVIQKMNLELQSLQIKAGQTEQKNQIERTRAEEVYEIAQKKAEENLLNAEQEYGRTRNRYRNYRDDNEDVIDQWEYYNLIEETSREVISAYLTIKAEYTEAMRAYKEAQDAQETIIRDRKHKLEDIALEEAANSSELADIEHKLKQVDIRMEQLDLQKLQKIVQSEGKIFADCNGVVSHVNLSVGKNTSNEAALLIADQTAGYRFTGLSTQEQCEYLKRGNNVSIRMAGGDKTGHRAKVDSLKPTDKSMTMVIAMLPSDVGEYGASAVLTASTKSESYNMVVSLSAIRDDGSKKFLLVMDEIETALGKEQTARRVDVIVQDYNEKNAAVTGSLLSKDKVIVSSSKTVRAGDKIRLQQS